MKENVIYRLEEFTDKDFSRLIRLTESTWPGREISHSDYLDWEYHQNPDGKALINVAEDSGKFVAQYVVIPHMYQVDGTLLKGSLSLNTLTHPMHRGNSLFPKLAELNYMHCVHKKCAFTLGVPNANSFPVFVDKLDFQTIGRVPFLMKTFQPQHVLWSLFTKKRNKQGTDLEIDIALSKADSQKGVSVFNSETDTGLYQNFLEVFIKEKKVALHRSIEFIRWRYENIPRRKYFLFKYVEEGKMKALAIFRAREIYGLRCLILMDFICTEELESADTILNGIFEIAKKNDIQLIICAMQSTAKEFRFLKKSGFYKVPERFLPQQLNLILRMHEEVPEAAHLKDIRSWFFTFGDYDIF